MMCFGWYGRRNFPHNRSFESESELEEERRLCYVGITRAKEHLWLMNAKRELCLDRLV